MIRKCVLVVVVVGGSITECVFDSVPICSDQLKYETSKEYRRTVKWWNMKYNFLWLHTTLFKLSDTTQIGVVDFITGMVFATVQSQTIHTEVNKQYKYRTFMEIITLTTHVHNIVQTVRYCTSTNIQVYKTVHKKNCYLVLPWQVLNKVDIGNKGNINMLTNVPNECLKPLSNVFLNASTNFLSIYVVSFIVSSTQSSRPNFCSKLTFTFKPCFSCVDDQK